MSTELHDFEDCKGPVQAARHSNGGGWVACTAYVNASAYVGPDAQVYGNAWVFGDAQVSGNAQVYGNARVSGNAQVYGNARVSGNARVYGNAWVSGNARVYGDAQVYGNAQVYGDAWVSGNARVSPIFISGLAYLITITDHELRAGFQNHTFAAWRAMTPDQIAEMNGKKATDFYPTLIGIIDLMCKDREAQEATNV